MAAVAVDAARDADRVGYFLDQLGLGATPEKPLPMPAAFLLHLGAALRLLAWETQPFFFHRAAGLPEAPGDPRRLSVDRHPRRGPDRTLRRRSCVCPWSASPGMAHPNWGPTLPSMRPKRTSCWKPWPTSCGRHRTANVPGD